MKRWSYQLENISRRLLFVYSSGFEHQYDTRYGNASVIIVAKDSTKNIYIFVYINNIQFHAFQSSVFIRIRFLLCLIKAIFYFANFILSLRTYIPFVHLFVLCVSINWTVCFSTKPTLLQKSEYVENLKKKEMNKNNEMNRQRLHC